MIGCAPALSAAARAGPGASSSSSAPKKEDAKPTGIVVKPEPSEQAAGGSVTAAHGASGQVKADGGAGILSGTGETIYELGGSKFASASQFKGKWIAGLREFYQKDGAWMPGKKGIALSADQFETVCANQKVRASDFVVKMKCNHPRMLVLRNYLSVK